MTTDFCPWANRFVYWLKEPIGWFVLATAVSVLIGLYFSPIGWTLAASLSAIMAAGMIWPWVAVHVVECGLRPDSESIHEDDACQMIISVRNRVPMPVWGLTVEGYFDCESDDAIPTVGLACIPPFCVSEFKITVTPTLRGRYPIQTPSVVCSFPFGIWTARRRLGSTKSLMVWPKVFPIRDTCPMIGLANAEHGEGNRGGRRGDFVGVRAYRQGDSAKHINWVASARTDSLIVTERSGPQCVELDVVVDTSNRGSRDQLADRIRVAASVLLNLQRANVPLRVQIGSRPISLGLGAKGRRQLLDALAIVPADGTVPACGTVPADGTAGAAEETACHYRAVVLILSDHHGQTIARLTDPHGGRRAGGRSLVKRFRTGSDLAERVREFWTEVRDVDVAA